MECRGRRDAMDFGGESRTGVRPSGLMGKWPCRKSPEGHSVLCTDADIFTRALSGHGGKVQGDIQCCAQKRTYSCGH